MEQDEVYGLDEMPNFCGEMDSDQETTNVVDDGLSELPYFCTSDNEVSELKPSKNLEQDEIGNNGIDRISDMPDHVLCKILGFMPKKCNGCKNPLNQVPRVRGTKTKTKEKIRTDLRIHFEMFVDQLLLNVPCLDVFNLKCHTYSDDKKLSWVSAALRLNVRELSFTNVYLRDQEDFFHVLNGYTGLARLEFKRGSSDIKLPHDFTLPNLTTLVLSDLHFWPGRDCSLPNLRMLLLSNVEIYEYHMDSSTKLINSCLALEVLSFKRCDLSSYGDSTSTSFCLSIECPSLKNLTIEDCNQIWYCSLVIDAPKLQVLVCKGFSAKSYKVSQPFDSLLSAHIDVEFSYSADGVEELVAVCSSAVHLYLCAFLMDALHFTCAQLPLFQNLNRLALGYIQLRGWAVLAGLLCNSPNFEKLTFKQGFCIHDGGYSSFESLMTSCPPCLELHVNEIEFLIFDEKEDEIKLVEYFMNTGNVIETLTLHCLPFKYKSTRERLAMLPRQARLVFQPR